LFIFISHTNKTPEAGQSNSRVLPNGEVIMSHKKPQRLLTIDQIVKRQLLEKLQSVFLASVIFIAIGGAAYIALVRG